MGKYPARVGLGCVLSVATSFFNNAALAADAPASGPATVQSNDLYTLTPQEIIVTASRMPEPLFDSPVMGNVITDQEMTRNLYRSTPEALAEIPGVLMQKTSQSQTSPFIRGFTGFRTLMLVDGIRLNNSVFRDGPNEYWSTVDNYSLDRLELVKGPSSVLYGSDAIGGTVNAVTKSPYTWGSGLQAGGLTFARLASADSSYTIHPEISATYNNDLGVLLTGTYKDFGDLRGGRNTGEQENTGYSEWDGMGWQNLNTGSDRGGSWFMATSTTGRMMPPEPIRPSTPNRSMEPPSAPTCCAILIENGN